MTSLTALMRVDAGAGVPSAPAPAGDRFAALLAGEVPLVAAPPETGIAKLASEPPTAPADALPIEASVVVPLTLPVERQPSATTGKALPAITVDDAGAENTAPAKGRHPARVPGFAAPEAPEQVRRDDEGRASDRSKPITGEERPIDAGPPAYVIATTALPAAAPIPAMPRVEAPAARSQDVAIAALTPAVSFATPLLADVPVGAPALAPTATTPDRALPPTAPNEAVRQNPVEWPRPVPTPGIARSGADAAAIAPTVSMEQATAPIEAPRVAANHRSPQREAPARPSPREQLPQPAPSAIAIVPPGTDRLLRARPNTAYAREEIAVAIGSVAAAPITDTPIVREAIPAQIDTQSTDWMHSMIERIETLTGEHGQRETRLKLSPDALGEVELRLRESPDGTLLLDMDAVTPEARALLAEAAPRLVEMGEARGLRLSMQAGGSSGDGQPQHNRDPHRPGADAPLPNRRPATQQGNTDDERIA